MSYQYRIGFHRIGWKRAGVIFDVCKSKREAEKAFRAFSVSGEHDVVLIERRRVFAWKSYRPPARPGKD